jgi:predicted amidophosphoribosyltransferase
LAIKKIEQAILVDDVVTSGATLSEAAKVLKKAGVGKVWGITLAHGV